MWELIPKHTLQWCRRCLGHFSNENTLEMHKPYCEGLKDIGQIVIIPNPSFKIYFKNEPAVITTLIEYRYLLSMINFPS